MLLFPPFFIISDEYGGAVFSGMAGFPAFGQGPFPFSLFRPDYSKIKMKKTYTKVQVFH
jgi:hypothetical protein